MRILVANKFWYRRGGLERVMFDEIAWLEAAGHSVTHFSTAHPSNEPSPWESYFVPYLELGQGGNLSMAATLQATARMFWNREAALRFGRLVGDSRPDIIHVHGIHRQISPSILDIAYQAGVPVVQTLHDAHHICPADVLVYAGRETCEPRRCGRVWYGPAVTGRCVRNSVPASALSAAETSWQRISGVYERCVTRFISPSAFYRSRMMEAGWSVPIDVVPNAVPAGPMRPGGGSGFAVIGRLSREKGVEIACAAALEAGVELTVAGEGPLEHELRGRYPNVEFSGRLAGDAVDALVRRVRAVVVPSLWFENAPMAILESMSAGVPVIASNVGGVSELVEDGCHGMLVPRGDVSALAAAMGLLQSDSSHAALLGHAAYKRATSVFTPSRHLEALLTSYRMAAEARRERVRR